MKLNHRLIAASRPLVPPKIPATHNRITWDILLTPLDRIEGDVSLVGQHIIAMAAYWQKSPNVICPSQEIVNACKRTDITGDLKLSDLKLPYKTFIMTMPITEDHLQHIVIHDGDHYKYPGISFGFIFTGKIEAWTESADTTLNEIGESLKQISSTDICECCGVDKADVYAASSRIAINSLLIMQSYPEYVKSETVKYRRPNLYAGRCKLAKIITPSNLRQIVTERESIKQAHQGGSVAAHWRKGHWRRQPHSEKWEADNPKVTCLERDGKRYHMQWIRPYFVKGVENE